MPDNTIDWGQGAANNDIGWGQGPTNNTLSWGMIGEDSYGHDETNLMGGSEGSDYITTTTAEGYSGGSASCADVTFSALQAIPSEFLLQEEGGGFILQENGFKIIT
jgi:hypothetical protein